MVDKRLVGPFPSSRVDELSLLRPVRGCLALFEYLLDTQVDLLRGVAIHRSICLRHFTELGQAASAIRSGLQTMFASRWRWLWCIAVISQIIYVDAASNPLNEAVNDIITAWRAGTPPPELWRQLDGVISISPLSCTNTHRRKWTLNASI